MLFSSPLNPQPHEYHSILKSIKSQEIHNKVKLYHYIIMYLKREKSPQPSSFLIRILLAGMGSDISRGLSHHLDRS